MINKYFCVCLCMCVCFSATTTYSTTSADSTTTSCEPNDPPCLDYPGCSYISGDGCLRCYCFSCDVSNFLNNTFVNCTRARMTANNYSRSIKIVI